MKFQCVLSHGVGDEGVELEWLELERAEGGQRAMAWDRCGGGRIAGRHQQGSHLLVPFKSSFYQ